MHLCPRRRNLAAQVAEELKTVTYATPPLEERGGKRTEKVATVAATVMHNEGAAAFQPVYLSSVQDTI